MPAFRINETILMARQAFHPFQCIAWSTDYSEDLSLTVIDSTTARVLGRSCLSRTHYTDAEQWGQTLANVRQRLEAEGVQLPPWQMPID